MTKPDVLKRHASLLDRTAARLGLDLEEEVLAGHLEFDEIADAVLRCVSCANPEDCAHWLDRDVSTEKASPVYCRNRELLQRLQEAEK
ncbi:hypothetical protein SAMN05444000_12073 [Shimia gijangensis]|uniref:DUF6455 domain-containing protein n=1 Tax=Shimia gijangensis TaxID=1470563 RepID=A0A1M6Q8J0_9RHOB|nr:DUF6455 family protein [Shimia gijangensis]SHK16589.1 hypothetical protein SAMN05444000_12073 [Shimia gijangensis]